MPTNRERELHDALEKVLERNEYLEAQLAKARAAADPGTGVEGALKSAVRRARPMNSPIGDAAIKNMLELEDAQTRRFCGNGSTRFGNVK